MSYERYFWDRETLIHAALIAFAALVVSVLIYGAYITESRRHTVTCGDEVHTDVHRVGARDGFLELDMGEGSYLYIPNTKNCTVVRDPRE